MTALLEAAKQAEKILVGWEDQTGPEQQVLFALQAAIQAEEHADTKPNTSKRRVLTVTESAYDTIIETLEMDSQSLAFDKKLRAQIKRALYDIKEVSPKVRIDVHGGVAYVGQSSNFVEVRIVDHDNH